MRILHVLPGLSPGGMERLVIQLAADAAAHGDKVVVAAGTGAWAGQVGQADAEYVELPATSRTAPVSTAAAAACLARCMRQLRPEVVHAHNVRATALARLAIAGSHQRSILIPTVHGVAPGDYRSASRILGRSARRVIACAPSVARSLVLAGFPADRIDVITNGACRQPAGPGRQAALAASLSLGPDPLVVGIGRLVEQKDWPVFIAAAGQVDGASFAIAGDGPLRQDLAELAGSAGHRVRFLGVIDDIAALMGLAACVVATSAWEGLPLTVLEALSLGVPVVATAVDGITDVVPPAAALLVPPGEPAAVSGAISRVITDRDLAAKLRQEALAAAPGWAPDRMLGLYRGAYLAARAGDPHWV